MKYSQIRKMDISNGAGLGVSLFVSGCDLHCPGCFNEVTWDFNNGAEWTLDVEEQFMRLADRDFIQRISILGGEPLADRNVADMRALLKRLRDRFGDHKKIWLYTGRTYENIIDRRNNSSQDYLRYDCVSLADVLVDGPYIHGLRDLNLKFRGSSNQRIISVKKSLQTGNLDLLYSSNTN